MKKIISLLLIFSMICCNCFVAFAAEGEAKITSPSDGSWLDPHKTITVKWTAPSNDVSYKITILNEKTGNYIVRNQSVSGTSYSIKSNTLDFEQKYKIWVGTFDGNTSLGQGDIVYIKINDRYSSEKIYEEADFLYPSNNETIPADSDLKISLDGDTDLAYYLTVKDATDGNYLLQRENLQKNSYTIKKNLLKPGHSYKAWVGTYKKASFERHEFGAGNTIYFKTEEEQEEEPEPVPTPTPTPTPSEPSTREATVEAVFTYPEEDETVSYNRDLKLKWQSADIDTCYRISIKDLTNGNYITENEVVTGTSYKISASELKGKHKYKAWIGTYNNSDCDELIGAGDELFFETDGTIPVLVLSLTADVEDEGLVFEYELTGDNFGYADIVVKENDENLIYDKRVYDLSGEIVIDAEELEEDTTYVCEIQTYDESGEKAAYKSQKYTTAKSGFSVSGMKVPSGEIIYKEGFTVKGIVGSAYPIDEAKIVIFAEGNENDIKDIVHVTDYQQKAADANKFNINNYNDEVNFGILEPGAYTYRASVTDIMGSDYIAAESDFSVVKENIIAETSPTISVYLNNEKVEFDVPPIIEDGRTLVPLRAVFEKLGADVDWDSATKVASVSFRGNTLKITVGSEKLYLNNKLLSQKLDVKAQIIDSRTLIPLRYACEALGLTVDWDSKTKTITISGDGISEPSNTSLIDTLAESEIYIKQAESKTCTLASMVMIFRRRAILDENEYWWMIREDTMKKQGNWNGGLVENTKYENVDCKLDLEGKRVRINYNVINNQTILNSDMDAHTTIETIKKYLDIYPEGVVLYISQPNGGWKHAVALIGYDENGFYCADPAGSSYAWKKLNLMDSSLVNANHADTEDIEKLFSNCVCIWYVTKH